VLAGDPERQELIARGDTASQAARIVSKEFLAGGTWGTKMATPGLWDASK